MIAFFHSFEVDPLSAGQVNSGNASAKQNAGFQGVWDDGDETLGQTRCTQEESDKAEFEFERDEGVHPFDAFRVGFQPQQQQWNGGGDPAWDDRIAEMGMPNHDGDRDFERHAQIFLENRNNAKTHRTHHQALNIVRKLETIVNER